MATEPKHEAEQRQAAERQAAAERQHAEERAHAAQQQPQQPQQPQRDEKAEAEERERRRENSYGAQVILDYEGDAALGARGGAGGSIEANTAVRDADLIRLGHVPAEPDNSLLGSPPNFMPGKGPEPKRRAPKLEAAERAAEQAERAAEESRGPNRSERSAPRR